jgi:hypothetical protein
MQHNIHCANQGTWVLCNFFFLFYDLHRSYFHIVICVALVVYDEALTTTKMGWNQTSLYLVMIIESARVLIFWLNL